MEIIKDYAMHYIHLIGEAMSGLNILVNILVPIQLIAR